MTLGGYPFHADLQFCEQACAFNAEVGLRGDDEVVSTCTLMIRPTWINRSVRSPSAIEGVRSPEDLDFLFVGEFDVHGGFNWLSGYWPLYPLGHK